MSRGSSSTTVVNTPAPRSAEEIQADQLRLAEMQRQNDLAAALLPNQQALIEQQSRLIQYQMDHQGDLDAYNAQQLKLAQLQVQNQIRDAAMQEQLAPMQLDFLKNQNQLAIQQMQSLTKTTQFQDKANEYTLAQMADADARLKARQANYSPEQEAADAEKERLRQQHLAEVNAEAADIQLENLKRGTKPTAEQEAFINQVYSGMQTAGETSIRRALTDTLQQINTEAAQASGLRPTDTPISRLSERAGIDANRGIEQLTAQTQSAKAQAMLNYPLAASQMTGNLANALQSGTQFATNYQQQLQQQAIANRNQAFNMPQSVGFATPQSLFGGGQGANLSFMNPTGQVNLNPNSLGLQVGISHQGGTTQTDQSTSSSGFGSIIGGLGGLATGAGNLGWRPFSDVRLKEDIVPMGKTAGGARLYSYRYKGDAQARIGVMAQEVKRLFPDAVEKSTSGFLTVDYAKVK